jgi:SH3-like domain-containing protein
LENAMLNNVLLGLTFVALAGGGARVMESYTITAVEVHEAADAGSPVMTTIPGNQTVELRRCESGWCLIGAPAPGGWVREDELRLRGGGI